MNAALPKPGAYVVAVSGGVDSMVLLDLLQRQHARTHGWQLTVAHLDHGIRPDSGEDRRLVEAMAGWYGLPFVYREARLGPDTGEAAARRVRYEFLREVQRERGAAALITAHHQDDVLETAIINLLRGTSRRGLTALSSRPEVLRPLINVPKEELIAYARARGLAWREDSTNADETYLRNYVRRRLVPRFDAAGRARLRRLIGDLAATNHKLDALLADCLALQPVEGQLDRQWFGSLPHAVAREVLAAWLRARAVRNFDSKTLERLTAAAKTAAAGTAFPVKAGLTMRVGADSLALTGQER